MTIAEAVVVDASVAVKWIIREEGQDAALALHRDSVRSGVRVLTPTHFRYEVTNAIWRKLSRKIISVEEADTALSDLAGFAMTTVEPPDLANRAFELAKRVRPGAIYDLLYIALAESVGCPLWTADARMLNAAATLAVDVRLLSTYGAARL